ncbi:MAG: MCP four helix bundle domain-containing protein, partial [Asticcacaulis sp.]
MFKNLTVRARIIAAFTFVLACTLGLGLFAVNRLSTVNDAVNELATNWLPASNALGDAGQSFELARLRQLQLVTAPESERADIHASIDKAMQQLADAMKTYDQTVVTAEERVLSEKIAAELKQYQANSELYGGMVTSGDIAGAQTYFMGDMQTQARELRAAIQADRTYQSENGT